MAQPGSATATSQPKGARSDDSAIKSLEEELSRVESEQREVRADRADLLQQLADESDRSDPDPDRLRDLRAQLRRADRRYRDLESRRTQVLRDIDDEYRHIARGTTRRRRRVLADRYDAGDRYVVEEREPEPVYEPAYEPGSLVSGGAITRAINETGRLGNAIVLGHLGAVAATADAVSALADDLFTRGLARAGRPMEATMALPADVNAGLWRAADRLVSAPRRAVDSFYTSYQSTGP